MMSFHLILIFPRLITKKTHRRVDWDVKLALDFNDSQRRIISSIVNSCDAGRNWWRVSCRSAPTVVSSEFSYYGHTWLAWRFLPYFAHLANVLLMIEDVSLLTQNTIHKLLI